MPRCLFADTLDSACAKYTCMVVRACLQQHVFIQKAACSLCAWLPAQGTLTQVQCTARQEASQVSLSVYLRVSYASVLLMSAYSGHGDPRQNHGGSHPWAGRNTPQSTATAKSTAFMCSEIPDHFFWAGSAACSAWSSSSLPARDPAIAQALAVGMHVNNVLSCMHDTSLNRYMLTYVRPCTCSPCVRNKGSSLQAGSTQDSGTWQASVLELEARRFVPTLPTISTQQPNVVYKAYILNIFWQHTRVPTCAAEPAPRLKSCAESIIAAAPHYYKLAMRRQHEP